MNRGRAYELRELIEKASVSLPDEDAIRAAELFPAWKADHKYSVGDRIRYAGKLYKVVQEHTSQADWLPDATPALYVEVAEPGTIPVWKQPAGQHDAYAKGDRVHYPDADSQIYESDVDGNVWAPNVYGWHAVE